MKYTLINDRITAEITYRRGKLAAVDIKKGTFDFELLGLLVPDKENAIDTNILLPNETKQQKNAFYQPALMAWNNFYTARAGIDYRFTAADGIALSKIGDHLRKLAAGDANTAVEMWKHILGRWETLDDFYRNTPDLKFVNSQLNRILIQVKNGKQGFAAASKHDDADDLRRNFAR